MWPSLAETLHSEINGVVRTTPGLNYVAQMAQATVEAPTMYGSWPNNLIRTAVEL